ncbi:MAG: OsmC family protein [Bacteroidales bacterium]|nr:OsmC family protein [Bacteroidales bacterium]
MKKEVFVKWDHNMVFQGIIDNKVITLDTAQNESGLTAGIRPKALMLVALGGCTGMDVVNLLNKMREKFKSFEVGIQATIDPEQPLVYSSFDVTYIISGEELHTPKIVKAVRMSMDTYCGVAMMLRRIAPVNYHIIVNGVHLDLKKFEQ